MHRDGKSHRYECPLATVTLQIAEHMPVRPIRRQKPIFATMKNWRAGIRRDIASRVAGKAGHCIRKWLREPIRSPNISKLGGTKARKIAYHQARMTVKPAFGAAIDPERFFEGFENLMPFRVQNILLVSNLYDSFILREDRRLNELLIDESLELNLQQIPGITHVSSGAEALARWQPRFNLIVTNLEVGDM